ncbi:MAG: glycosyltransferase [Anaerolineales bacterium]|nr:MAG: glycosyltransferase [Anaerolineales bacterium]
MNKTLGLNMRNHLIIYAKRPLPGYAKTRLGAEIGIESSAGVYARLLYSYLYDLLHQKSPSLSIELSVASPEDTAYFEYAFPELSVTPQLKGDLGARMAASFQQAFQKGAQAVVLTGSDILGLNRSIIKRAFSTLEIHPGVIGPAPDGGYYLIGMQAPGCNLFNDITWSTQDVLAQTKNLAHEQNLNLIHLPTLKDMDDSDEYWAWRDNIDLKNM